MAAALLALDIAWNGSRLVQLRLHEANRSGDIAFEAAAWWRIQQARHPVIVADHYRRVYLPSDYPNVHVFKGYERLEEWVAQLRSSVQAYQPDYLYYNAGPVAGAAVPPIEVLLPGYDVELVKRFDSAGRRYQRMAGDRLLVYRIRKDQGLSWPTS